MRISRPAGASVFIAAVASVGVWLSGCSLIVGDVDGEHVFPPDGARDATLKREDAAEDGRQSGAVDAGRSPVDAENVTDALVMRDAHAVVDSGRAADAAHDSGSRYAAVVLQDGPLAYWRLDEPAKATNALDESGNIHTGLYEGDAGPGVPGLLTDDPDTAAYFNAATTNATVILLGTTMSFDFSGKTPFSLEAWVKPASNVDTASTNYPKIFVREMSVGASFSGYTLGLRGLAPQFARYEPDAGGTALGPSLTIGQIYHIVGTFDGVNDCIYENGTQAACVPDALSLGSYPSTTAAIGADPGPYFQFGGVIDEVAVYGTALSPLQVLKHYQAGTGE